MIRTLLSMIAILASHLYAGSIQNDTQFKTAVASMGSEPKMVLMLYTTNDCPECAYMKRKVFQDKNVETYMHQNFIVIEKNVRKDLLPDGYDFFGIPTMFFIDKEGNKKETIVGGKRSEPFLQDLHRIREK